MFKITGELSYYSQMKGNHRESILLEFSERSDEEAIAYFNSYLKGLEDRHSHVENYKAEVKLIKIEEIAFHPRLI